MFQPHYTLSIYSYVGKVLHNLTEKKNVIATSANGM